MKKSRHLSRLLSRAMKISLYQLLIVLATATVAAAGTVGAQDVLSQRVTLQANNQEIKTVLNKLNKLTQIRFTYNSSLIRPQHKVTINAVERPLGDVLDELFKPINVSYKIE